MVREAFAKICAQRSLWKISNIYRLERGWGGARKNSLGTFMEFLQIPYSFIPFCLYFNALVFKHIGYTHLLHIISQMKKEVHVFSFYKSHILSTKIFTPFQTKIENFLNKRWGNYNDSLRVDCLIHTWATTVFIENQIRSDFNLDIIYFILLKYYITSYTTN